MLIDIWARKNRPGTCYYDITWTGVVGREPSEKEQQVFEVVREARDAAVQVVKEAFLQQAADRRMAGGRCGTGRDRRGRSYGKFFTHRTGHNIR